METHSYKRLGLRNIKIAGEVEHASEEAAALFLADLVLLPNPCVLHGYGEGSYYT
jgi:hypothetical protein